MVCGKTGGVILSLISVSYAMQFEFSVIGYENAIVLPVGEPVASHVDLGIGIEKGVGAFQPPFL